jgi:hypothetical protein
MSPPGKKGLGNPGDILEAQRTYARRISKGIGDSHLRTFQNLIFANPPEVAADLIASNLTTSFGQIHYLFLFSINSDEDSIVFSIYSDGYSAVRDELKRLEKACHRTKVGFLDVCNLVMERTPAYVFAGKSVEGTYTWESGLSDLAISLRSQYAKEMPDKNHLNIIKEHFSQFGIEF